VQGGQQDEDLAMMIALAEQVEAEYTAASTAAAAPPAPPPQPPPPPQPQQEPTIEAVLEELLGLPLEISQAYRRKGVARPYPWQHACLRAPGVLDRGRNLLYSAPTSGGKSFVADGTRACFHVSFLYPSLPSCSISIHIYTHTHTVLLLRRVLATRRKALLVLPFVAVVREKVEHLRELLHAFNVRRDKREAIRIREFHGGKGGKGFGA
jgi:DNA polymerase theta